MVTKGYGYGAVTTTYSLVNGMWKLEGGNTSKYDMEKVLSGRAGRKWADVVQDI